MGELRLCHPPRRLSSRPKNNRLHPYGCGPFAATAILRSHRQVDVQGAITLNRVDEQWVGPAKTRIAFIDIGRALAALLVFYSHLAEPWIRKRGEHAPYVDVVEALTSVPMLMAQQGIGQIAVPFFFLVSGFVVTPIAMRQGQFRFTVNRVIRVYAPLLFTVALTAVLVIAHLGVPSTGQAQTLSAGTLLSNVLLANYLMIPQVVLVPVAWTLIIEVAFYVLLVVLIPVLRRSVWLAIAVELTLVFVVLMSARAFGPHWFLVAVTVSYMPILIIGQAIWAASTRKIPTWAGGLYLAAAWSLYVLADRMNMGRIDVAVQPEV